MSEMSSSSEANDLESGNLSQSDNESDICEEEDEEESDIEFDQFNLDIILKTEPQPSPPPPPPPPAHSSRIPSRFPFIAAPGCTFILPEDNEDILSYYQLFIDDYLVNLITTESNRFAAQQKSNKSSPTDQLPPFNVQEMQLYFGLKILQNIVKKPNEQMYWSKSEVFHTPIFSKLLSHRRYLQLKQYLHFVDDDDDDNDNNDLDLETTDSKLNHKIWETVIENLKNKFSSLYIPERQISIEESLILYKADHSYSIVSNVPKFVRSNSNSISTSPSDIKLYLLCEPDSNYFCSFEIYRGKDLDTIKISDNNKNNDCWPVSLKIVLSLMEPLLNMGYCLKTNGHFTNIFPQLSEYLIQYKTTVLNGNGQIKKNYHEEEEEEEVPVKIPRKRDKHGNLIKKPKSLTGYKRTDRMTKKKKYYQKIFFHLLDICVWNAFVLYQKNDGQKDSLEFCKTLLERLIEKYHSSTDSGRKLGRPRNTGLSIGPFRLTERHFPEYVPPTKKKAVPYRYCAVCTSRRDATGKKIRKETRYFCGNCNVGLCAVPCFMDYHTKLNF